MAGRLGAPRQRLLQQEAFATLAVVALGLAFGAAAGLGLGLVAGMVRPVARILDLPVNLLFAVPKVALVPLFIVWFGVDLLQQVIFTASVVFFFFFFAALGGVRSVPAPLGAMLAIVGASPLQRLRLLYLPASLGWILSALRVAVPYAFVSAITTEVIASRSGLGNLVKGSATAFDAAGTFAAMLALLVLSVICSAAALALGGRLRWNL